MSRSSRVEFVDATGDKCDESAPAAILASFSNGQLNSEENAEKNVRFRYLSATGANFSNRNEKMLVAETDRTRYVGRNFGQDAVSAPSMCQYMIGIYDKRTKKVQMVNASMFQLRPSTGDSEDESEESTEQGKTAEEDLSLAQKHARLTEEFGTTKGKRLVEAKIRNRVKTQALETIIASAADDSAAVMANAEQSEASGPVAIPPHNLSATQPEDVYLLSDIISSAEMSALMGPSSTFVNATVHDIDEWRENGSYPGYVMHQLSILPVQQSVRQHRSAILMYWTYMHRLLHNCSKSGNESKLLSDVPAVIRRTLFERFTLQFSSTYGKSTRTMPARLKDLLRSYMLVLCLILEEFTLDFTALQRDLDLPLPQLEKCFQALGCKTSRHTSKAATGQTSKSIKAVLVVPLTFPAFKARAGRR